MHQYSILLRARNSILLALSSPIQVTWIVRQSILVTKNNIRILSRYYLEWILSWLLLYSANIRLEVRIYSTLRVLVCSCMCSIQRQAFRLKLYIHPGFAVAGLM